MQKAKVIALAIALAAATSSVAFARSKPAKLLLAVAPANTEVYVDGHKKGTGDSVKELVLSPGPHELKFVHDGDEHDDQVVLEAGKQTRFEWAFEDDKVSHDADDYIEQATAAALQ